MIGVASRAGHGRMIGAIILFSIAESLALFRGGLDVNRCNGWTCTLLGQ